MEISKSVDSLNHKVHSSRGDLYTWLMGDSSDHSRRLRRGRQVWLDSIPRTLPSDSVDLELATLEASILFVYKHIRADTIIPDSLADKVIFDHTLLLYETAGIRNHYRQAMVRDEKRVRLLIQWIVLTCLMISSFAFVATWLRERSDERWIEFISTEDGLGYVFRHLVAKSRNTAKRFTIEDVTVVLEKKQVTKLVGVLLGTHVDAVSARKIAPSLLERLLARGVISKEPKSGIFPFYSISSDVE